MNVTVSVPGKINIMGEHAVVHGKPSVLTAVNLRLTCMMEARNSGGITDSIGLRTCCLK